MILVECLLKNLNIIYFSVYRKGFALYSNYIEGLLIFVRFLINLNYRKFNLHIWNLQKHNYNFCKLLIVILFFFQWNYAMHISDFNQKNVIWESYLKVLWAIFENKQQVSLTYFLVEYLNIFFKFIYEIIEVFICWHDDMSNVNITKKYLGKP